MSVTIEATIDPAHKHDYDVTALLFTNGKLYSASDDGKIKIWNQDLKFENETQAHPCSIYSLASDGTSTIYSCSNDGTVRAWSLDKLEEKGTICTSEREFWKLYWNEGILYIVNDAGTIFIYEQTKYLGEIEMLEQIKDLAVLDRMMYSVRDLDLVITEQVGDKRRGMTRTTLCGRAPLCVAGNKLIFSSRDGRSVLINFNNKEQQFKNIVELKDVHEKLINAVAAKEVNGKVQAYSGGWDCVLKQWLLTEDGHSPGSTCTLPACINVICLNDDGSKIYVAGGEGNIWRLNNTVN